MHGAAHRLAPPTPRQLPWLGREVVQALLTHAWPGNTRELIAVADQLAERFADAPTCGLLPSLRPEQRPETEPVQQDVSPLEQVLREHAYRIGATACALNITPVTLRRRLKTAGIPLATSLGEDQIRAALVRWSSYAEAAQELRVSEHAMKLRMKELGIGG